MSVCGNVKHFRFHEIEDFVLRNKFRYHQIKDFVQFRYRIFKRISNKKQAVFLRLVLVQVTGLEPTRLMRHRHLKLALSVCGNAKHFRYHQIEDLVQFRHCCFKMYQQ